MDEPNPIMAMATGTERVRPSGRSSDRVTHGHRSAQASTGPAFKARHRLALVGTYPPTHCGLATFTSNVRAAIATPESGWEARVIRVLDEPEPEQSHEVTAHWITGDRGSLWRALDALGSVDVVLLQHEYGLFGGDDGEDVIDLVENLQTPFLAVLHTTLLAPSTHQRQVLERVIDAAAVVVVQSEAARQRLEKVHGTSPERIMVIPHGAASNFSGPLLHEVPRPAVLTWGLLSPGKGIEQGIDAVSRLSSRSPAPFYIVAGQTHPKEKAAHGEGYRDTLRSRARILGCSDRVCFEDGYRNWDSLRALVRSADVVLLPYESRDQVSSGVLVEAVASGKPVVATRFPHAEELLADGAGLVVDHGDVEAMTAALDRVLYEPGLAERMAAAARQAAQPLLWPVVGAAYRSLIEQVIKDQKVA